MIISKMRYPKRLYINFNKGFLTMIETHRVQGFKSSSELTTGTLDPGLIILMMNKAIYYIFSLFTFHHPLIFEGVFFPELMLGDFTVKPDS